MLGTDPRRAGTGWRARVGIVLQSTGDLAELTPHEVVHHIARYYPDSRDPDETLALVGLHAHRHMLARALSGGQRRRLDVALGIVGRPELLFLDEPTTGFDPQARRESGYSSGSWRPRAPRSCSPPTTSRRPRRSPTASR